MVESRSNQQIGYILRSYPRLSQTFILNEVLALEQAGVPIHIFAVSNPHEAVVQTQVEQVRAQVDYLSEDGRGAQARRHRQAARAYPLGYRRALLYAVRSRQIDHGYTTQGRMACFSSAVTLACLLDEQQASGGQRVTQLHAHFAHDPTLIAQLTGLITGTPYSFTAHARDLYQVPRQSLAERIRQARAVVTCCQANLDYLSQVEPRASAKYSLVHHGVDLEGFQLPPERRNGSETPLILAIGRLVEKKGFFDLVQALDRVRAFGAPFKCEIYGEGPLRTALQNEIAELGLESQVILKGSRTQAELIPVYQRAALFALTPYVTEEGDRDGIPNVLLEAMAAGLPVVSTTAAGIPELVTPGKDGLLFPPHDSEGIARGIAGLLQDENRRMRLGAAARSRVADGFDLKTATARLVQLFGQAETAERVE